MGDNTTRDLLKLIEALDIYIEMESGAVRAYRAMAHRAEQKSTKALLAWLYCYETSRLLRLEKRRRLILTRHPEFLLSGGYVLKNSGITKIGAGFLRLARASCLAILRFAIANEARAMQFFQGQAIDTKDPVLKFVFGAAVKEQDDCIAFLGGHRSLLIKEQADIDATSFIGNSV